MDYNSRIKDLFDAWASYGTVPSNSECGPNETQVCDLMIPETCTCVPHEPLPPVDPGMNSPDTIPANDKCGPNETQICDLMIPETCTCVPNEPVDGRRRSDQWIDQWTSSFWRGVFEQTDWNKVYSDMAKRAVCEVIVLGILFFLGTQSKI